MLLQIQDGTLSIGGQTVLSHFHFEIRGNEKIAVIGRNGCGKTTLLRLLAGELALDRDDKSISPEIYTSRKTTTGFLSQQAFSDLSVTVEKELLKCCPCPDKWDRERFAWEQEYDRVFTGFGFTKEDKKKRLEQFSGGEQTKIAMIRLLLQKPDLLLLDEPTNNLDIYHATNLMRIVRRLCDELGKTVILVLHEINYAAFYSDYICAFVDGKIAKFGTVQEVITKENLSDIYKVDFEIMQIEGKPLSIYY